MGCTSPSRVASSPWASTSRAPDRKSTRLNSSHPTISYAVFCLKKKKKEPRRVASPLRDGPSHLGDEKRCDAQTARALLLAVLRLLLEVHLWFVFFFFFNDTAPTEIYTLSLPDALPICAHHRVRCRARARHRLALPDPCRAAARSEEHTSELQSHSYLVCRLLLEKQKKKSGQSPSPPRTGPPTHSDSALVHG